MKIKSFLLLALLIPGFSFAQQKVTIELEAPSYIHDSLLFAPPIIKKGLEKLYNLKIDSNDNISDFGKRFGIESTYIVKIKEKNIIDGQFSYPQPFSFQYYNKKEKRVYLSSTFFLEAGHYKINLPEMFNSYEVNLNSPVNKEYFDFKKLFSDLYVKLDNGFDSLTSLTKKEERIGAYIKTHPDSYVAFWEIVKDFTFFNNNNSIYLNNLQLFSDKMKATEVYKIVERNLNDEKLARAGSEFPEIHFDKQNTLTKESFKKYKLTFIDYWSTTCAPCIEAMPKIAEMYNKYKDKGINFITVTDENQPEKIELAKSILSKNNVTWANYFDLNKDFKNKVNGNVYPLQFLVDENGIIITRVFGKLNVIERVIDEKIK